MTDNPKQIILGIDPGSRCTGYGLIWTQGSQTGYVAHGQIATKGDQLNIRLQQIQQALCQVIDTHCPTEAAIEEIFTCHNPQSALKLGQARGAALVATAQHLLPVAEYSARQIKQAIAGYGAATKAQMQHMVTVLLKLKESPPPDAADALAIALCHAHTQTFKKRVESATITAGANA